MFDDAVFLQEGFDASAFVGEQRKELTLEKLCGELEAYVAGLDNSLVNIINNDYSAFLKLSSMLVDLDALVAGLRDPLDQLEDKVVAVRDVVGRPLGAQEDLLERLLYVQEKKKVIHLCLSARETLDKVEQQVQQVQQPAAQGTSESVGEALGRATQRLARVSFLSQENQGLPLLRSIRAKARSLEHSLLNELDKAFVQAVEARAGDEEDPQQQEQQQQQQQQQQAEPAGNAAASRAKAVAVVLRAYLAINNRDRPAEIFKTRVVKPFLAELFTPGKLDAGGARGSSAGLGALYKELLCFVQQRCKPVLRAVRDESEGLSEMDFVSTSICQAVREAVEEHLEQAYSSGVAETLHSSYVATEALFRVLERLSPDPRRVRRTAHETLALWNVSVYTQLRSQQLLGSLEVALAKEVPPQCAAPVSSGEASGGPELCLDASRAALAAAGQVWHSDVFLPCVGPQLFKLALELYSRYGGWAAAAVRQVAEQHGVPVEHESALEVPENEESAVATAWAPGVPCEALLSLAWDCERLAGAAEASADACQARLLPGAAPDAPGAAAVGRALRELVAGPLRATAEAAEETALRSVERECVAALEAGLAAVAPMYRLTSKPPPTEACAYVAGVLKPLRVFVGDAARAALLRPASREGLEARVFGALMAAFEAHSAKVLEEVVNSENALRRLKRNKSNRQLDSDKIRVQFLLDLEALAADLGDGAADDERYKRLAQEFAPAAAPAAAPTPSPSSS